MEALTLGADSSGSPSLPWEPTSCGVDWVTVSSPHDPRGRELWLLGEAALADEVRRGSDQRVWRMQGYCGWIAGGVAIGSRDQGVLVQLTSETARTLAVPILRKGANVSRLDLQVTARNPETPVSLARLAYEAAIAAPRRRGRPRSAEWRENSTGGTTAYFGRRVSARYARLYDKGAESGQAPPGTVYRWELELKPPISNSAAIRLLNSGSVEMEASGMVYTHFASLSIAPPWSATDVCAPSDPRVTDDDRRLAYLRNCVRPMVGRLIRAGRRAEVLEALDVSPAPPAVPQ